jgi:hypothetical protein
MKNFVIYAHDKSDIESSLIYICTCDSQNIAKSIVDALNYRDTGGRNDDTGIYNYYIKNK